MIPAVYRSAAAMLTETIRQDILAHNLANVDTPGFKRCMARVVRGGDPRQQAVVAQGLDLTAGPTEPTGSPLDVALRTPGFFVLDTGGGRRYTRDGHFMVNREGYLVNSQGLRVLGLRGPIRLQSGAAAIAEDGAVTSNGRVVDRLLVVEFPPQTALIHDAGNTVVGSRAPTQVATYAVAPGMLEGSNVSPVVEMVAMGSGYRIYEANARVVGQVDRTLGRLIEAATS